MPARPSYTRLYNLAAWRGPAGLRAAQLRREPLCCRCSAVGRTTAAEHVDHIVPHRGDMALFLAAGNLRSLCLPCHTAITHGAVERGADLDGLPLDPTHPWHGAPPADTEA